MPPKESVKAPKKRKANVVGVDTPLTRAKKKKEIVTEEKEISEEEEDVEDRIPPLIIQALQKQARINKKILTQLHRLETASHAREGATSSENKAKCGQDYSLVKSQSSSKDKVSKTGGKTKKYIATEIDSDSETEDSESEEDNEAKARKDIRAANSLLQAEFSSNTGNSKTASQRSITKDSGHPEELSFLYHVEGLSAMAAKEGANTKAGGIMQHVSQIMRDVSSQRWKKVRKWSNKVVVKTAIGEWDWEKSTSDINQLRNSVYVEPCPPSDQDFTYPCYSYNKGECKNECTHFEPGITFEHCCEFCFAIDGSREYHTSKTCGKRRSSSNYFKIRAEGTDGGQGIKSRGFVKGKMFTSKDKESQGEEKPPKN